MKGPSENIVESVSQGKTLLCPLLIFVNRLQKTVHRTVFYLGSPTPSGITRRCEIVPRGVSLNLQTKRKGIRLGCLFVLVAGVGLEPHDLRVMSPTSYQLLYPAIYSAHQVQGLLYYTCPTNASIIFKKFRIFISDCVLTHVLFADLYYFMMLTAKYS